ncbi:hypothetical protein [Microbulbifer sp. PSTR4-B]|uniref:hypothetical protein n=1 Tax=Microbulbifer sp. PSTR4-B TaxID=3243396 RepID=UPI004039CA4A
MNKVHVTFLIGLVTSGVAVAESFYEDVGIGVTSPQATLHIKDSGSKKPAILISGASSTEGDIAVLNDDTFQLGNWIDSTESYINWLEIDTENVKEFENDIKESGHSEFVPGNTKTRLKLIGDNSHSTIFHYSGFIRPEDHNVNLDKECKDTELNECLPYREELALRAVSDGVNPNNNGAGAHFYGNQDSQHGGWIGFFTDGKARMSINKQGRVGVGSKNVLDDYKNYFKGRFNIINPENEPGLYIEGAGPDEGDIAWKDGEYLQMGTWEASMEDNFDDKNIGGEFHEVVRITHAGNFSVKNPIENDDSPGYIQLDTSAGTPPDSDCNSSSDVGRMTIHQSESLLYVCASSGWKSLTL